MSSVRAPRRRPSACMPQRGVLDRSRARNSLCVVDVGRLLLFMCPATNCPKDAMQYARECAGLVPAAHLRARSTPPPPAASPPPFAPPGHPAAQRCRGPAAAARDAQARRAAEAAGAQGEGHVRLLPFTRPDQDVRLQEDPGTPVPREDNAICCANATYLRFYSSRILLTLLPAGQSHANDPICEYSTPTTCWQPVWGIKSIATVGIKTHTQEKPFTLHVSRFTLPRCTGRHTGAGPGKTRLLSRDFWPRWPLGTRNACLPVIARDARTSPPPISLQPAASDSGVPCCVRPRPCPTVCERQLQNARPCGAAAIPAGNTMHQGGR